MNDEWNKSKTMDFVQTLVTILAVNIFYNDNILHSNWIPFHFKCVAIILALFLVCNFFGPRATSWFKSNREEKIGLSKNQLYNANGYIVSTCYRLGVTAWFQDFEWSGNGFLIFTLWTFFLLFFKNCRFIISINQNLACNTSPNSSITLTHTNFY